jgi:DNA polymerase III gamma/tau subunit
MTRRLREDGGEGLIVQEKVKHDEHLHTKYRPRKLKDVLGQGAVVKSLEKALEARSRAHCFLFTGPAGTGKTTLARIVSDRLDIPASGIIEVDAASNTGIDDVRKLCEGLRYSGFGDSPNKAIILNECHRLSKQAWDALLMTTEEPPSHVFFFFTSTDPDKVPKAMVTRCLTYVLHPLKFDDIMDELEAVVEAEQYGTSGKILEVLARAADGSMRAALTGLAKVHGCDNVDEARQLLQSIDSESPEVIDLCRKLLKGDLDFPEVCSMLDAMDKDGVQPESIRLVIVNYLNRCIFGHKSKKDALRLLDIQALFMKPMQGPEKMAPLLQAFGTLIYD